MGLYTHVDITSVFLCCDIWDVGCLGREGESDDENEREREGEGERRRRGESVKGREGEIVIIISQLHYNVV